MTRKRAKRSRKPARQDVRTLASPYDERMQAAYDLVDRLGEKVGEVAVASTEAKRWRAWKSADVQCAAEVFRVRWHRYVNEGGRENAESLRAAAGALGQQLAAALPAKRSRA